jgi:uncharacterized membrane protein
MDRETTRKYILKIALCGVFTAVVFLATQIKVSTSIGYANLGDGFILASSFLLGPIAFFPAAIGSALADLFLGYANYVPATFIIKGLMGLVAGLILKQKNVSRKKKLLAVFLAELIMVSLYFGFESLPFMYGPAAASGSILANAFQGVVAMVLGIVFMEALQRLKIRYYEKLH